MKTTRTLLPTRKWFATQVTALTGWAIAFVNVHGHWTTTIIIALITIGSQALIGWLVPNDNVPAGVPRKSLRGQRGYAGVNLLYLLAVILVLALAFKLAWWAGGGLLALVVLIAVLLLLA